MGGESQAEAVSNLRSRAVAQVQLRVFCNSGPLEAVALIAFGEVCILFRCPSRQWFGVVVLAASFVSWASWLLRIAPRRANVKGVFSFMFGFFRRVTECFRRLLVCCRFRFFLAIRCGMPAFRWRMQGRFRIVPDSVTFQGLLFVHSTSTVARTLVRTTNL